MRRADGLDAGLLDELARRARRDRYDCVPADRRVLERWQPEGVGPRAVSRVLKRLARAGELEVLSGGDEPYVRVLGPEFEALRTGNDHG